MALPPFLAVRFLRYFLPYSCPIPALFLPHFPPCFLLYFLPW
ncbi:hypothetical protein BN940_09686 [Castellaniella defragrans 65Phen]|uniref:Uncharacterized protein n=1 Tax=Castellaniella defragrans (strain DSM 12143 / CCUG 39792 / 65Phen) TaxID=1437824 RepID=W8X3T8_CASD6|nr:hypothetical protein BN940_09686 [Castellaniella defragrans 65Phen]